MASAGYSELPEEITNSPMIDCNDKFYLCHRRELGFWNLTRGGMSVRLAYALAPHRTPDKTC